MKKTAYFVIWICSKFVCKKIEEIIEGLLDVLTNRDSDVKPKDDFKEKHPEVSHNTLESVSKFSFPKIRG